MLSSESFWTSSLRSTSEGGGLTRIFAAAINAVDPGAAIERFVHLSGDMLSISDRTYDLKMYRRIALLGFGKGSLSMSTALIGVLGVRLDSGLIVTKHTPVIPPLPFPILEGDHPVPGENSLQAGQRTIELVSSLGPDDLLICAISGGGSALITAPHTGISLADIQQFTSLLLTCGARIDEINTLRRRLDRIKGGGIAQMTNGATIINLILSDVVGNSLESIASGPTSPDPATRKDALSILGKYELENRIPISILRTLRSSHETPKPGDPVFKTVQNVIVGSNLLAAQASLVQAKVEGFHPYLLRTDLQGEARLVAFELSTYLRQVSQTGDPVQAPACIVAGGETTVTVMGDGRGGRNTELALAAVGELAGFPGVMLATLATDGEDGSCGAAGAVVTGGTFQRAVELGMEPADFLVRNDSCSFFSTLDDLLEPGPTGTNVNDLVFMFIF
jgi:glycerate 2-kinase